MQWTCPLLLKELSNFERLRTFYISKIGTFFGTRSQLALGHACSRVSAISVTITTWELITTGNKHQTDLNFLSTNTHVPFSWRLLPLIGGKNKVSVYEIVVLNSNRSMYMTRKSEDIFSVRVKNPEEVHMFYV